MKTRLVKWEFLKWVRFSNWDWFPKIVKFPNWYELYYNNPNIISKWFSWFKGVFLVDFSMDHDFLGLKEMDLKILDILEKLGIFLVFWTMGLSWTSVLGGWLGGRFDFYAWKAWISIGSNGIGHFQNGIFDLQGLGRWQGLKTSVYFKFIYFIILQLDLRIALSAI